MENNKLQELTDKLYNEGLLKGKQEATELTKRAKEEANEIIAKAQAQAVNIIKEAEKKAKEMEHKVVSDLKMASTQTITAIKQDVVNCIITKSISEPVKNAVVEPELIKSIITKVVDAFKADNDEVELSVIIDNNLKDKLDSYLKSDIAKRLKNGLEVKYSKQVGSGFKIGPKDEGYYISFTDSEFESLLANYLRPATRQILFGE